MFTKACNLLDECFQQTIAGPSSIPIRIAFGVEECQPQSLRELGNICNIPNQQCLRRYLDEHPYLTCAPIHAEDKTVLEYYAPIWTNDFFLNPNCFQYLYSTSLVINECQKAIKSLLLDPLANSSLNDNLVYFFKPTQTPSQVSTETFPIANATRLLQSTRTGSDRHELLLFLQYLSEIHWFDIYTRGWGQRDWINGVVHWVCTTLVG